MTALLFQTCTLLCHQNLLFGVTMLFLYFSSADACFLSYFVFPVRLLGSRSSPSVVSTFDNWDLLITFVNQQQQFEVLQMTQFWVSANIFNSRLTRKTGGKPQMCKKITSCYELEPLKSSLNVIYIVCDIFLVFCARSRDFCSSAVTMAIGFHSIWNISVVQYCDLFTSLPPHLDFKSFFVFPGMLLEWNQKGANNYFLLCWE